MPVVCNEGAGLLVIIVFLVLTNWSNEGKLKKQTNQNNHDANSFTTEGDKVIVSSDDMVTTVYRLADGELLKTLQGYLKEADTGGLDYDPNSRWDYYIKRYTDLKNEVRISPDGRYLVKGKIGTIARMWEIRTGSIRQEFRGHDKAVLCFEFTQDGQRLITGSADHTIRIWDVATGKTQHVLKGHRDLIFSLALSPDERQLLSTSWDGTVRLWDLVSGQLVQSYILENNAAYRAMFSPDGLYFVTAGLGKATHLWEPDTKRQIREFIGHTDIVQELAFHPTTGHLYSIGWDGSLRAWNTATGMQQGKWQHHKGPAHALAISKEGHLLATGGADRRVWVVDAATGKVLHTLEGHEGAVTSLQFSADGQVLVSCSADGMVKVWNLTTGKEIFSHIVLGASDWMVKNDRGYFNATQGAMRSIVFVQGMESYEVTQFFEEFYRPDLLQRSFGSKGASQRATLAEQLKDSPPPQLAIIRPLYGQPLQQQYIQLEVDITNTGGGIDEIKLLHNGKALPVDTRLPTLKNGATARVALPVVLVPGLNTFQVSAFSESRIESAPEEVLVKYKEMEKEAVLHVLAIGIDVYKNPSLQLNFARADAESIAQLWKEKGGSLFEKVNITTLFDAQATRVGILEALDRMAAEVRPEDVFLFYFAGHGSMLEQEFFFIPTEATRLYQFDKLRKEALPAVLVQEKFRHIPALKQVVLIDACQSGGATELLASRGASEEKALAQLSRSAGVHVLSAAGSEQFAVEFKELGHGLFTYVLLEALSAKADGAPKDGKVTIYELKSYLDDRVPEYSLKYKGKMQFPYTFSRGHDFPVVLEK